MLTGEAVAVAAMEMTADVVVRDTRVAPSGMPAPKTFLPTSALAKVGVVPVGIVMVVEPRVVATCGMIFRPGAVFSWPGMAYMKVPNLSYLAMPVVIGLSFNSAT